MLRTCLSARLAECDMVYANIEKLVSACFATELVHTASLCHDDVIDNGLIRRGQTTLWKITGASNAVLIGDLLLCEAIDVLLNVDGGRYIRPFVSKVKEVCTTEIEQEIVLRGGQPDEHTCMRLARGKTGPLFAFVGLVYGGNDLSLSSALEDAGYRIGTAYQLADDLLDIVGDERLSGKTLGSDSRRRKFTLPQSSIITRNKICEKISELCLSALDYLNEWPRVQRNLEKFFESDLQLVFNHIDTGIIIA